MGRRGTTRARSDGGRGYRGPDRRPQSIDGRAVGERSWVAAAVTLGGLIVAFVTLALLHELGPLPSRAIVGLRSAAAVLAVVLAVLACLHWRATGQVRGWRFGLASGLLAVVGVVGLLVDTAAGDPRLARLGLALSVVAAAWVAWALLGPDVDTGVRPGAEAAAALGGIVVGAGLLAWLTPTDLARPAALAGVTALVAGLIWGAVAVVGLVRAVAASSALMGWMAWLATGLAVAEIARFAAWIHAPDWLGLGASATLWGLLLAVLGTASSLGRSVTEQRGQVYAASLDGQVRERAASGRDRERAHEIRNALFAIEGATNALEHFGDELSSEQRAELSAAVSRGIGHLRELVDTRTEHRRPVALGALVAGRAALIRARGVPVEVRGDDEGLVLGDEVLCAQIVDNLLSNAVRHGDGARGGIEVEIVELPEEVRVEVRDGGPGVPEAEAERVFTAGVRLAPEREGDGLGLPLARTLARRQNGELELADPGLDEGARFVLSLPRADRAGGTAGRHAEGAEHLGEVVEVPRGRALDDRDGAATPRVRSVVEDDHDVGVDGEGVGSEQRDVEAFRGPHGQ